MERRNTIFLYILWDDQKTWFVCFFQASVFWGFVYFLRIKKSHSVKIDAYIWNISELCKMLQTIIFTFINAITFSQCGKQNQSTPPAVLQPKFSASFLHGECKSLWIPGYLKFGIICKRCFGIFCSFFTYCYSNLNLAGVLFLCLFVFLDI